jgi:hypothetical protein
MCCALPEVKTTFSRSSASLVSVTCADHFFLFADEDFFAEVFFFVAASLSSLKNQFMQKDLAGEMTALLFEDHLEHCPDSPQEFLVSQEEWLESPVLQVSLRDFQV